MNSKQFKKVLASQAATFKPAKGGHLKVTCFFRPLANESDPTERDAIVSEVQELIDDCAQPDKVEGVYVRFDDLESIAADVPRFEYRLRALFDERGGIGKLAELTTIPQPSLSRFFNSAAMPRRTTLHKIARALNMGQIQIATEWSV